MYSLSRTRTQHAVSVFIRLAFAHKKNAIISDKYDSSWSDSPSPGVSPLPATPTDNNSFILGISDLAEDTSHSRPTAPPGKVRMLLESLPPGIYDLLLLFGGNCINSSL